MAMADWIDKYPRVKALLQASDDELAYGDALAEAARVAAYAVPLPAAAVRPKAQDVPTNDGRVGSLSWVQTGEGCET
jgi:hypothetical protein